MTENKPNPENGKKIDTGTQVTLHYTLKVEGTVVDSSEGRDPLTFTHGQGQLIPGVEDAIKGLGSGDEKSFQVSPDKGYGNPDPNAIQSVPKTSFKDAANLKNGDIVGGEKNGRPIQAKIIEVSTESVKLDFNHPLAGKTLDFSVKVVSVSAAPIN